MARPSAFLTYVTTAKMGKNGKLTIPKQFRDGFGLCGSSFDIFRLHNSLILLARQRRFDALCCHIGSTLAGAGKTPEAILATLPEARKRVFARHYGKKVSPRKLA
jgi:bifunctional DNA-binding transcriptional regulator/antitoxin component of YhaV-PrlF toxin-antitoxin module